MPPVVSSTAPYVQFDPQTRHKEQEFKKIEQKLRADIIQLSLRNAAYSAVDLGSISTRVQFAQSAHMDDLIRFYRPAVENAIHQAFNEDLQNSDLDSAIMKRDWLLEKRLDISRTESKIVDILAKNLIFKPNACSLEWSYWTLAVFYANRSSSAQLSELMQELGPKLEGSHKIDFLNKLIQSPLTTKAARSAVLTKMSIRNVEIKKSMRDIQILQAAFESKTFIPNLFFESESFKALVKHFVKQIDCDFNNQEDKLHINQLIQSLAMHSSLSAQKAAFTFYKALRRKPIVINDRTFEELKKIDLKPHIDKREAEAASIRDQQARQARLKQLEAEKKELKAKIEKLEAQPKAEVLEDPSHSVYTQAQDEEIEALAKLIMAELDL